MMRIITPDLSLRTFLEGKSDLTFVSMSKILRPHFGELNATTLYTKLSNPKQTQNESAREFVIRLMALRHKILFESLMQERFFHALLVWFI